MPATSKNEYKSIASLFPKFNEVEGMPHLNAKMLIRANEIMFEAAKAIWESEVELLKVEAEEGSKFMLAAGTAGDPAKSAAQAYAQWRDSSEKILTRMRGMSDQMRKCGWDLLQLYAAEMKRPDKTAGAE